MDRRLSDNQCIHCRPDPEPATGCTFDINGSSSPQYLKFDVTPKGSFFSAFLKCLLLFSNDLLLIRFLLFMFYIVGKKFLVRQGGAENTQISFLYK